MLCNFSKIFENIVKGRLINFLEQNKIVCKNKFGFRPDRSTTGALYFTTQFIYKTIDNNEKVI